MNCMLVTTLMDLKAYRYVRSTNLRGQLIKSGFSFTGIRVKFKLNFYMLGYFKAIQFSYSMEISLRKSEI